MQEVSGMRNIPCDKVPLRQQTMSEPVGVPETSVGLPETSRPLAPASQRDANQRDSSPDILANASLALEALHHELQQRLGTERVELWLDHQVTFQLETGVSQGASRGDPTLRVLVPTQFQRDWLSRRLRKPLRACCQRAWQCDVNIVFQLSATEEERPEGKKVPKAQGLKKATGNTSTVPSPPISRQISGNPVVSSRKSSPSFGCRHRASETRADKTPGHRKSSTVRNPNAIGHGTFSTFVAGPCNTLAHSTARLIAEQPGRYCPLLLYGPSGVGKSHLLNAIRQQARSQSPRLRTVSLTSEEFTTQFLEALNRRSLPSFRQKYRTVEVLLLDDIQFLARKRATLEELLYTIDALHNRGSQVVLASDRGPGDLQMVSPELVSRISSGLAVPIDLPDYETRVGIVSKLALRMNVVIDPQVSAMVASRVTGSARQLSGAINRLLAGSMALGQPITPELARPALAEFSQQNSPAVRLPDIQRAVCEVFCVEPASLKSNRKTRSATQPRMLAMWLARKYTRSALSEISDFFGRRSHSTVISAQKKVESLLKSQKEITVADRPCHLEEAIRRVESVLRRA